MVDDAWLTDQELDATAHGWMNKNKATKKTFGVFCILIVEEMLLRTLKGIFILYGWDDNGEPYIVVVSFRGQELQSKLH